MQVLDGRVIAATIEEICALGPRWMGSRASERATDLIAEQFQKSGLEVAYQPFPYLSYSPQGASFSINGKELQCQPIALSASTTVPMRAPLILGGECTRKELKALQENGIALNNSIIVSENLRSFVAYPEVEEAGAVGFVSLTNVEGNTIRCGCARLDRKPGSIPAVAIGGEDGCWIIEQLGSGQNLQGSLEVRGKIERKTGYNVVGRKPGAYSRKILITAHYDSFWNGVHALDNASGVATVIALSRALEDLREYTLEFVAFGGEELGFWGSFGYVRAHQDALEEILAVVNLDTFGSKLSKLEIGVTADLHEFCQKVAKEMKIDIDCWSVPPRAASDQHSFVEKGVSAIWLANCGSDLNYHTPLDTPSKMSPQKLETAATLAHALVTSLAGENPLNRP